MSISFFLSLINFVLALQHVHYNTLLHHLIYSCLYSIVIISSSCESVLSISTISPQPLNDLSCKLINALGWC